MDYILRMFFVVARSRAEAQGEVPVAVAMSEVEATYRAFDVSEVVPLREFADWMIFLDNVVLEYYMEKQKPKSVPIPPP